MSQIDGTYFIQDIAIPSSNLSNLSNIITRYEPKVLTKLLGYELYTLLGTETSTRITELIEGKEYTIDYNGRDQKVKWNGLKNSDKISLISYYVYFYWQQMNLTHTSKLGEVKAKAENAKVISGGIKASTAWHNLRKLYGYYGQHVLEPSCLNFLIEHEDTYPELVFTPIGDVNAFDI